MNLSINRGPSNSQTIFPPYCLPASSASAFASASRPTPTATGSRHRRRRPRSPPNSSRPFPPPGAVRSSPVTIPFGCSAPYSHHKASIGDIFRQHRRPAAVRRRQPEPPPTQPSPLSCQSNWGKVKTKPKSHCFTIIVVVC